MKDKFLLRPDIHFLNFGSFGACPVEIFEEYQRIQRELEYEPVQFIAYRSNELLFQARKALGDYIGADADDLVYTSNPSYAINIVARSLRLQPGDEILTTDLEYGAMDRTWNYYAKQYGYTYRRQHIRLPLQSSEDFEEDFWAGLNRNTRVIFISQITSSSALILPVENICRKARELGLLCIVDGAHAPGQIPVDLRHLNADFYTGACHKWMMAPKGASFLFARREVQDMLDPLVVSWGYESSQPSGSRFIDYHQQQGTRDLSAFLTVPACIRFLEKNKWEKVSARCRNTVHSSAPHFAELLGTKLLAPLRDEFIGQMCSFPINTKHPEKLKDDLYKKYRIEIPVMVHGDQVFLRYSIQAFNTEEDLQALEHALTDLLKNGDLLKS